MLYQRTFWFLIGAALALRQSQSNQQHLKSAGQVLKPLIFDRTTEVDKQERDEN